jgi:hypothetical protein
MTCTYSVVAVNRVPKRYLVTAHIQDGEVSVACYQSERRSEADCIEYAKRIGELHQVPFNACTRSFAEGLPGSNRA